MTANSRLSNAVQATMTHHLTFVIGLLCVIVGIPCVAFAADQRRFEMTFTDETGHERTVRFSLSKNAVAADLDTPLGFPYEDAVAAQVKAARRHAATCDGVKVKVRGRSKGISVSVSGTDRRAMRRALKETNEAAEEGLEAFIERRRWTRHRGKLLPDHARLAHDYSDDLVPLADVLSRDFDLDTEEGRRGFALHTLRFVQAIPYEKRKGGGDKGYRRPLAVLARNKGDCDSKSVLYLAILRAALPDLAAAVVYIPQHTFVAIGLERADGELTVKVDGQRLVIAEPVGPATTALGDGAKRSRCRARANLTREVAVPGSD